MALHLWFLAVMCSSAAALPTDLRGFRSQLTNADVRNSVIEEAILSLLESLREDMVTGAGAIPVLDPFHVEHLRVDGDSFGFDGSHIDMRDVEVNKLSTFSVDTLSVTLTNIILQRYRILLSLRVPSIDINSGNYNILLQALGYSIFGDGSLRVSVVDPQVRANIVVGVSITSSGIFLNIRESEVNFDLVAFESKISGLFNNEIASDFANRFLEYLVPDLVEEYQNEITTALSKLIMELGNEILKDINIIDIIG